MKLTQFNKRQKEYPNVKTEPLTESIKVSKTLLRFLTQKKLDSDADSINDVIWEVVLNGNK